MPTLFHQKVKINMEFGQSSPSLRHQHLWPISLRLLLSWYAWFFPCSLTTTSQHSSGDDLLNHNLILSYCSTLTLFHISLTKYQSHIRTFRPVRCWFSFSFDLIFKFLFQSLSYNCVGFPADSLTCQSRSHVESLCSVSSQFSPSVMSDSLWPHGLQHAWLPCPSPTPRAYSNITPSSRWWHPTFLSSVVPFSSCLQSFPASGSFQMSQFSASGGQNIGISASASALPMNSQDWSPLGWTGWISLQSKGLSRVFSNTTIQKHQFFSTQLSLWSNSHIHTWPLEKP